MKRTAITALLFLLFLGCASSTYYAAEYDLGLAEVTRPADAEERYGEKTVTETDSSYTFEDEFISTVWVPMTGGSMLMLLTNKTDHSMQIDWNQGAYVGPSGSSERLVHGEVRQYQLTSQLPPTVIPSGGTVSMYVGSESAFNGNALPTSYSTYGSDSTGVATFRSMVEGTEGENIKVLLPLKIQEELNEYTFTFEVNDAEVKVR